MKRWIILSVVLALLTLSSLFTYKLQNQNEFSKERWNESIWSRRNMIEDLTGEYDLGQMTYDDIVELLGTNGIVENSHLQYYVGKSTLGPIIFTISFDEKDKVISYSVIID